MRCSWILAPLVLLLAGCCCPSPCEQPGKVIAADEKAKVYVISLGEEDGVKPGFQYAVSRGNE